jgi:AraC-like DNA-binding protein
MNPQLSYIAKDDKPTTVIMNVSSPLPVPVNDLVRPRVDVSPFVRAFVLRDTRGCGLEGDRLLNRFPASSHCVITWFLEGGAELLSKTGGQQGVVLADCIVSGCLTQPLVSRNRGEVHSFMAVFYPDAFHALFGVDLGPLQNRCLPARDVLSPSAMTLVDAVFAAQSHCERQSIVERHVMEHMREHMREHGRHHLSAWLRIRRMGSRISLGVASRVFGIGPRQLQRLAVRETGVNLQTLVRLKRGERSFLGAQRRHVAGLPPAWAEHALACDYADQSHMARECKAQTGRTPAQLVRDVWREEADWIYRLDFPDDEDSVPSGPP